MGIDIYARWRGQTLDEIAAQTRAGFSVEAGSTGYLREAYHGEPYATRHLCAEAFDEGAARIQYADALATNAGGSTTWQTLYDAYPSQGTNTFIGDFGNYYADPIIPHPKYSPMRFYRILAAQSVRLFIDEKRQRVAAIAGKLQKLLEAYLEELIDREAFAEQKQKLLDEKKALQEQIAALEGNRLAWLESFRKWILTAKTSADTASTGSLQERKALAQEIFGSNLVLDTRQARGSASKPWCTFKKHV